MSHTKHGKPDYTILPIFPQRWSPYCFDGRPVSLAQLKPCFEAARWSASSYNEQPWYFVAASKDQQEQFQTALGCLLEANQGWAKYAGALVFAISKDTFTHNSSPNRVHAYDLGQAVAQFSLQAENNGLHIHQMAGINASQIRALYGVPDGYQVQTAIAVGFLAATPLAGQESLAGRDSAPRTRKSISEFVYTGRWGQSIS